MEQWRTVVQRRMATHAHPIELVRDENARGRDARWIAVLYRTERRVFDSRWVALELTSERGARWLVGLVRTAIEASVFAPPRGSSVAAMHRAPIVWTHRTPGVDDHCVCEHGGLRARVETASSGLCFVAVSAGSGDALCDLRHTTDVQARTGDAGRFLAELVLDLATAGRPIPRIA